MATELTSECLAACSILPYHPAVIPKEPTLTLLCNAYAALPWQPTLLNACPVIDCMLHAAVHDIYVWMQRTHGALVWQLPLAGITERARMHHKVLALAADMRRYNNMLQDRHQTCCM